MKEGCKTRLERWKIGWHAVFLVLEDVLSWSTDQNKTINLCLKCYWEVLTCTRFWHACIIVIIQFMKLAIAVSEDLFKETLHFLHISADSIDFWKEWPAYEFLERGIAIFWTVRSGFSQAWLWSTSFDKQPRAMSIRHARKLLFRMPLPLLYTS